MECRGCGTPSRFPLAGEDDGEQPVTCARCGWSATVRSPVGAWSWALS
jgi:hypothetical protein